MVHQGVPSRQCRTIARGGVHVADIAVGPNGKVVVFHPSSRRALPVSRSDLHVPGALLHKLRYERGAPLEQSK
eukprot:792253-Rhodomonas_salina.1